MRPRLDFIIMQCDCLKLKVRITEFLVLFQLKFLLTGKEYFVCDFKGHCVVVFNEEGQFLRRIGCDSITNFPNGIDISDAGDVLVGDSHGNRFHVAVFSRDGSLLSEFECPYVKVNVVLSIVYVEFNVADKKAIDNFWFKCYAVSFSQFLCSWHCKCFMFRSRRIH
jgi:hypothetical protein